MVNPGIIILYLMVKTMVKHGKTGVNIQKNMVYSIYITGVAIVFPISHLSVYPAW